MTDFTKVAALASEIAELEQSRGFFGRAEKIEVMAIARGGHEAKAITLPEILGTVMPVIERRIEALRAELTALVVTVTVPVWQREPAGDVGRQ
jgi:hypothetical protein